MESGFVDFSNDDWWLSSDEYYNIDQARSYNENTLHVLSYWTLFIIMYIKVLSSSSQSTNI